MAATTLAAVIDELVTVLRTVTGLTYVPADPPEHLVAFPAAVVHPVAGRSAQRPAELITSHDTIAISLLVPLGPLPRRIEQITPYRDSVVKAIMQALRWGTITARNIEGIDYTFGEVDYAGRTYIGYTLFLRDVKYQRTSLDYGTDIVEGLSPIAYWKLAETSGTTASDETANAYDGTYQPPYNLAAVASPVDGDNAPGFDLVTAHVVLPGDMSTWDGNAFTVSLWAKADSAGRWSDGARRDFLTIYDTANSAFITLGKADDDRIIAWRLAASQNITLYGDNPGDTDWHHYAVTYDTTSGLALYIDGSSVATGAAAGTWPAATPNANRLAAGGAGSALYLWPGYLSHAALYDAALNASQVLQLATVPV